MGGFRRQTVRDRVLDDWCSTRAGDPVREVEGWGLGTQDRPLHDDFIELRQQMLKVRPRPPEWKLSHIAPWIPPERRSYWDPTSVPLSPYMARRQADTAARKEAFLRLAATGMRVRDILTAEEVSVSQHTYARWRREDPEWCNRLDRIRAGLEDDLTWKANDFASRRRYFFGYESYTHHQLIIDAIEATPIGGITMILLPPEAGKTTLIEDWLCDQIAHHPSSRILYVSDRSGDGSMSQKVLTTLKDRMTDPHVEDPNAPNARIGEWQARYGPFRDEVEDKDKPWNQNYIKVHKASGRRDYTFQACGWRSRVYGSRADWLIFDDVQSEETLGQTEAILRRMRKTFFTRARKGRTIIIGTRIGPGDVYEALIDELDKNPAIPFELVMIPALDEEGHSYCEEMWTTEQLAVTRSIVGEDTWWTAYMMQPKLAEDATFTDEMVRGCMRADLVAGPAALEALAGADWRKVASLDPALGGGNALTVAAYTTDRLRILDLFLDYRLTRNEEIFIRIEEAAARYGFTRLVIERNSQQRGIARDDRLRALGAKYGFEIVEHETGANKWDAAWGIRSMASTFIRREIEIPDGDDWTAKRMEPLVEQLTSWRPDVPTKLLRQDAVMSLWFNWRDWQREREVIGMDMSMWTTKGTPWTPGDMTGRWGGGRRRGRGRHLNRARPAYL